MKFIVSLSILLFAVTNLSAQEAYVDSCLRTQSSDTLKVNCLMNYAAANYRTELNGSVEVSLQALEYAENADHPYYLQKVEGWLGYLFGSLNQHRKAMHYNYKALAHRKEINDIKLIVNAFNNLGQNYTMLEQYDSARMMYQKAFNLIDQVEDSSYHVTLYSNLSQALLREGEKDKALQLSIESYERAKTYKDTIQMIISLSKQIEILQYGRQFEVAVKRSEEAVRLAKLIGNKMQEMKSLNQLGVSYSKNDQLDKALSVYKEVLDFVTAKNIPVAISSVSLGIGDIYKKQKKYQEALNYFFKALEINEKYGYKSKVANVNAHIGRVYMKIDDYKKAAKHYEVARTISEKSGNLSLLNIYYQNLGYSYFQINKFKKSAENYLAYVEISDSLNIAEREKAVQELSTKYETEKKQLMIENLTAQSKLDSIQKVKDEEQLFLSEEKRKAQRNNFLIGGGALSIVAVLFIIIAINRKKTNKRLASQNDRINEQKDKILSQKHAIEEKNNEITDSINYAFRIQSALLPPPKMIQESFPNAFVMYKPKDIVAGDFYWMHNNLEKGIRYIAAADCTGHGVPGAMVSVICNNGLNRSVREFGLQNPGEILDKTREIVIQEFEKSTDEVKDGMDIALCALRSHSHSHTLLQYSGANNPLWIIRNGAEEVEEIKADKQPIGQFENAQPFTTHEVKLNEGDTVYIFSDGYADQFGGEKGKKLKTKNFKSLLLSIQDKNMEEQKSLVSKHFEEWRGEMEQLDDVCVIGVRV